MLFRSLSVDLAPDIGFGQTWYFWKLAMPTFKWHKYCIILSSSCETAGYRIRVAEGISLLAVYFPILTLGNSGMLLTKRKNLLLGKLLIFEK